MLKSTSVFDQCVDNLIRDEYVVIDHFLSSKEVGDLQAALRKKYDNDRFKRAGIGKDVQHQVNTEVRKDFVYWIDPERDIEIKFQFLPYLKTFMQHLKQSCFIPAKDYEMHYSIYFPGAYYKRHLDQFKKDGHRVMTFLCYLNFDWKEKYGGALRIYKNSGDEDFIDIMPEAGRFVYFRSDKLEHEVLETKHDRYSICGWILSRKKDLNFL